MPATRFVRRCAVLLLVVVTASWLRASSLMPEQVSAAGALEQRAKSVSAQNPVPRLTRVVMPQNPMATFWPPIFVALRVTLDEQGRIGEVRTLGPGSEQYSFYVSRPTGGEVMAFTPVTDRMPPPSDAYVAYVGFVNASMNAVRQWQYEPPISGPIAFNILFGFEPSSEARLLSNGVTADTDAASASPPGAAAPTADAPVDWTQGAVRVGNRVAAPSKVKDVAIVYPPIAHSARVQGVVTIDVRIEADGRVSDARVVDGPPLLRQPALDSVRRWEFTPTVLDGKSIPVITTMMLTFRLFP